jgi:hypothetical protein
MIFSKFDFQLREAERQIAGRFVDDAPNHTPPPIPQKNPKKEFLSVSFGRIANRVCPSRLDRYPVEFNGKTLDSKKPDMLKSDAFSGHLFSS